MADSRIAIECGRRMLLGLALLLLSSAVFAGPAFVSGASVTQGGDGASITILLACQVNFLSQTPNSRATVFRIQVDATGACNGVSPTIADTQEYYLPSRAAEAKLTSIEYDGTSFGSKTLTLSFSDDVLLTVNSSGVNDRLEININFGRPVERKAASRTTPSRRVPRAPLPMPVFVINLESSIRPPATADMPNLALASGHKTFVSEVEVDGRVWYRTRLGFFDSKEAAAAQLEIVREQYPTAWIDRARKDAPLPAQPKAAAVEQASVASAKTPGKIAAPTSQLKTRPAVSDERLTSLMSDGRQAMTEGQLSTAVQIYTKVLQYPEHEHMPEAQEYLALARERNGQTAHAKAEYQRYLALYPDTDGAARVNQRLMALLAKSQSSKRNEDGIAVVSRQRQRTTRQTSPWRIQTFFSQYYRRDANQIDENDEVISQSSLYSDMNFDARRRGTRFDFSSRISAGYRYDLLDENEGPGDDVRVSYGYANLADTKTGLSGRVGRQSRNSGGVLGRFDGLNIGYQATERTLLNAVVGKPVNSAADGIDDTRTFYGLSANFGPIADNLDIGGFYVRQDVDGLSDREAVGTELRYFDSDKSLWGLIDYDVSYQELGSVFLQGTYRLESQLTFNALVDRRRSPFLSTSNAMIGQSFADFAELVAVFGEQEVRRLSLDRSAITTTYTIGASFPLSPKFQVNSNLTQSSVSATPESGGVAATPESDYNYYSMNLVASSLFREGDVSILGLRYSQSQSADVISMNLDARYPFSRSFYVNPRIRADYRQIHTDSSTEWIFTPGVRVQYRLGRTVRIELQAGKQFAARERVGSDVDRESYFVNLGYQAFF